MPLYHASPRSGLSPLGRMIANRCITSGLSLRKAVCGDIYRRKSGQWRHLAFGIVDGISANGAATSSLTLHLQLTRWQQNARHSVATQRDGATVPRPAAACGVWHRFDATHAQRGVWRGAGFVTRRPAQRAAGARRGPLTIRRLMIQKDILSAYGCCLLLYRQHLLSASCCYCAWRRCMPACLPICWRLTGALLSGRWRARHQVLSSLHKPSP